jgi:hypothetical protein
MGEPTVSGGQRMDVPDGYPQTHFFGLCDACRTVKQFTSAAARDEWENNHDQHEEADDA